MRTQLQQIGVSAPGVNYILVNPRRISEPELPAAEIEFISVVILFL
jgi:hypothetical protein